MKQSLQNVFCVYVFMCMSQSGGKWVSMWEEAIPQSLCPSLMWPPFFVVVVLLFDFLFVRHLSSLGTGNCLSVSQSEKGDY